jgi:hypothetical protein
MWRGFFVVADMQDFFAAVAKSTATVLNLRSSPMRKIALSAAAALLLAAAPVTAQEAEILPTEPCEVSEEYTTLGLDGTTEDVTPSPIPAVGTDFDTLVDEDDDSIPYHEESTVSYLFRLDLSGSEVVPDASTGNVNLNLMWDNDGDYDLYVYDAEGNAIGEGANGFNPINGAGEQMMLSRTAHCTDFRVDIVNYLGVSPVTAMDLTAKISSLRP